MRCCYAQLQRPAIHYASCTILMENSLQMSSAPYRHFRAYNENQLRFSFLAEKLITPSASSRRTRQSCSVHKKQQTLYNTAVWGRLLGLISVLCVHFLVLLFIVIKLTAEDERKSRNILFARSLQSILCFWCYKRLLEPCIFLPRRLRINALNHSGNYTYHLCNNQELWILYLWTAYYSV
jgi:hypothetical protein